MCLHRTSLALIGSGSFIRDGAIPLIVRDGRIIVKAIFAFQQNDAENLSNDLKLGDSCGNIIFYIKIQLLKYLFIFVSVVYSGSNGLSEILNCSEIDACIVDVHPELFVSS